MATRKKSLIEQVITVGLLEPLKCPDHPKYKGKRAPRASCETCYYIWEGAQR